MYQVYLERKLEYLEAKHPMCTQPFCNQHGGQKDECCNDMQNILKIKAILDARLFPEVLNKELNKEFNKHKIEKYDLKLQELSGEKKKMKYKTSWKKTPTANTGKSSETYRLGYFKYKKNI